MVSLGQEWGWVASEDDSRRRFVHDHGRRSVRRERTFCRFDLVCLRLWFVVDGQRKDVFEKSESRVYKGLPPFGSLRQRSSAKGQVSEPMALFGDRDCFVGGTGLVRAAHMCARSLRHL